MRLTEESRKWAVVTYIRVGPNVAFTWKEQRKGGGTNVVQDNGFPAHIRTRQKSDLLLFLGYSVAIVAFFFCFIEVNKFKPQYRNREFENFWVKYTLWFLNIDCKISSLRF